MSDQNYNQRPPLVSPEVQVMVEVTKASTEQLVQVNEFLRSISVDIKHVRNYFETKDGFQKDIDGHFERHMTWLWLKFAGALSAISAIVVGVYQLVKKGP